MSLIERARQEWHLFTTDKNAFGVDITISTPSGSGAVDVVGLHTKHHIGLDAEGNLVNTKNAHIGISEQALLDAGYVVRGADGEVDLIDHRVTVADSTGNDKEYVISESFPDETAGFIVCILTDFE